MEIWKSIEGYEGLYEVSNFGRVKSLGSTLIITSKLGKQYTKSFPEKILKSVMQTKYLGVNLYKFGDMKSRKIHKLVANAFIPNTDNKPYINHKDSNKLNNHVDNLEWVTPLENNYHSRLAMDTKTKYPCITKMWNKYRVRTTLNGKRKYIGLFSTEQEALDAYNNFLLENNVSNIYQQSIVNNE